MMARHSKKSIKKRFERKCKCDLHTPNDSRVIDIVTERSSKMKIAALVKRNVFTKRRKFICKQCLDLGECSNTVVKEVESSRVDFETNSFTVTENTDAINMSIIEPVDSVSTFTENTDAMDVSIIDETADSFSTVTENADVIDIPIFYLT